MGRGGTWGLGFPASPIPPPPFLPQPPLAPLPPQPNPSRWCWESGTAPRRHRLGVTWPAGSLLIPSPSPPPPLLHSPHARFPFPSLPSSSPLPGSPSWCKETPTLRTPAEPWGPRRLQPLTQLVLLCLLALTPHGPCCPWGVGHYLAGGGLCPGTVVFLTPSVSCLCPSDQGVGDNKPTLVRSLCVRPQDSWVLSRWWEGRGAGGCKDAGSGGTQVRVPIQDKVLQAGQLQPEAGVFPPLRQTNQPARTRSTNTATTLKSASQRRLRSHPTG